MALGKRLTRNGEKGRSQTDTPTPFPHGKMEGVPAVIGYAYKPKNGHKDPDRSAKRAQTLYRIGLRFSGRNAFVPIPPSSCS
jgi:hypothetical protein